MKISTTEKNILQHLCFTDAAIAKRLNFSVKTVKCYVHNLLNKLICNNRRELIVKALKNNIINLDEIYCL